MSGIEVKSMRLSCEVKSASVLALSSIEPGFMYVCYKSPAPKDCKELQGYQSGFLAAMRGTEAAVPDLFLVSLETVANDQ